MLRGELNSSRTRTGLIAMLLVGLGCGSLVYLGNPGNMGICGACFLRDSAGALRLFGDPQGLHYLRPEVLGVVFGALLWMLLRGKWQARSGSHAATRFFLPPTRSLALSTTFSTVSLTSADAWSSWPSCYPSQ